MYYNFTNKDVYHSIFDSSIVSKKSDYKSFSKELNDLIEIENNDYIKKHSSNMKNYMSFPEDYKLNKFISTKIDHIIQNNK